MQSVQNNAQDPPIQSFEHFSLKPELLQSIFQYGFQKPAELQAKGIPSILAFNDTVIHSQAGSGKSALCTISTLQMINPEIHQCQALILVSTRELATQAEILFSRLGDSMGISMVKCVTPPGGAKDEEDLQNVEAQIIIGTVMRIGNLIKKGLVQLGRVRLLVLDEADESFSRGYENEIRKITGFLADDVQIVVSTSTVPNDVEEYIKKFMNSPVSVRLTKKEQVEIEHFKVDLMKEEWKFDTVCDLFEYIDLQKTTCIVFCNKKKRVEELVENLRKKDYRVACSMDDRIVFDGVDISPSVFNMKGINILVAVDTFMNDFNPKAQILINYDVPLTKERYMQRGERCGLHNKKSLMVSFYTEEDKKALQEIEKFFNLNLEDLPEDFNQKFLI